MAANETTPNRYDPTPRTRGRRWMAMRSLFLANNPLCIECKKTGRVSMATEVDHIIPLFKGGTDALENLNALCSEHHADKTRKDMGYSPVKAVGLDGVPEGWK